MSEYHRFWFFGTPCAENNPKIRNRYRDDPFAEAKIDGSAMPNIVRIERNAPRASRERTTHSRQRDFLHLCMIVVIDSPCFGKSSDFGERFIRVPRCIRTKSTRRPISDDDFVYHIVNSFAVVT